MRTALGEKTQISERQRAEGELHKLGVELFFHTYIDRFTFAEITHNTAAHKYDAIIYLDERVTNEEKCANATFPTCCLSETPRLKKLFSKFSIISSTYWQSSEN